MSGLGIDHEIKRIGDQYYNHVTPIARGVIQSTTGDEADVYVEVMELTFQDTPLLKPCYKEGTQNKDITAGDAVIVAFMNGNVANPLIIGKI